MRKEKNKLSITVGFLLIISSTSLISSFSSILVTELPTKALSKIDSKAEALKLFEQGKEQFQASQFEAALKSWRQALSIYREIKNRRGEQLTLGNIGLAYLQMGDYPLSINYSNQSLT